MDRNPLSVQQDKNNMSSRNLWNVQLSWMYDWLITTKWNKLLFLQIMRTQMYSIQFHYVLFLSKMTSNLDK